MWLYKGYDKQHWEHTSFILAYINNAHVTDAKDIKQPFHLNPYTIDKVAEKKPLKADKRTTEQILRSWVSK